MTAGTVGHAEVSPAPVPVWCPSCNAPTAQADSAGHITCPCGHEGATL